MVTTKEQRKAIFDLYRRNADGSKTYREFRKRVAHYFGGYIGINGWCGMFVGIEKDGYTHT